MNIMGIVGWKNSGKTTLMVNLITEFKKRGLKVAALKHAHHRFNVDIPGKDSYRYRQAGAQQVLIGSPGGWAQISDHSEHDEPSLDTLLLKLDHADIVLIEGFKQAGQPKIEVHRRGLERPSMASERKSGITNIVGLALDEPLPDNKTIPGNIRILELDNPGAIADFILDYLSISTESKSGKP